jgi:DNA mismatch endonuclease (patch repair protein)
MRGNRKTGTRPEMVVRRLLHAMGYRYRLHAKDLPGRPDVVFRKRRLAIQVHGCFWHQHEDPACPLRSKPRSNSGYWDAKLARNVARDREAQARLTAMGWRVEMVWECECRNTAGLAERLREVLGSLQQ